VLDPLAAWNAGVTLNEALLGKPSRVTEYAELYRKLFPPIPPADVQLRYPAYPLPALPYDPAQDVIRFLELDARAKFQELGQLSDGERISVGYRLPRTRGQRPEWIPANLWGKGGVSWESSGLWGKDYAFEDVRILDPSASMLAEVVDATPAPEPRRGRGRPPAPVSMIVQVYRERREAGRIDFAALSHNFAGIRNDVLRLNPFAKGLGDRSIRKTLRHEFAADRQARGYAKRRSRTSKRIN
jgi:hypothetical protein